MSRPTCPKFSLQNKRTPTTRGDTPEPGGAARTVSCDIHVDIKNPDSFDSLAFTNVIRRPTGPNEITLESSPDMITCAWKPYVDMNQAATFGENFEREVDEASTSSPFEDAIPSHHPHYTIRNKWNLWTILTIIQLILTTHVTFQYVRASWLLPRNRSDVAIAANIDDPPSSSSPTATAATAQPRRRPSLMPIWIYTALAKCAADRSS